MLSVEQRFWPKVDKRGDNECWEWQAGKDKNGYGKLGRGIGKLAHRVSWELNCGPIPQGMCICHKCDNPPCVNPAHLFLGSKADNSRDMAAKGRKRGGAAGERHGMAKLTAEDVLEIRRLVDSGVQRKAITQQFGISKQMVYRIIWRVAWKHI